MRKIYGKSIKLIRKSKGISQVELAQGIMSRSNLSNFENNHYIPTFDKVIQLLTRLNLSTEEFILISDKKVAYYQTLYNELTTSENCRDLNNLIIVDKKIANVKFLSNKYYELYLLSQYVLNLHGLEFTVSVNEIKSYIKPLLFKSDQWFKRELQLYNNFLFLFDYSENQILYNKVIKKLDRKDIPTPSKEYRVHLSLNYGIQLINEECWELANKVLIRGKSDAHKNNLFFQELLIDCLILNQTEQTKYIFDKLIDLGYENKLNIIQWYLK
ncbi:helix-turn-helix transcriptional regulator [Enterococcus sp. BWB1-3]|uniref:helix-turn-helix domain-containing protein n=1 Tax=Enterococcus sp. BWB1-3 TaxID=2787713 RepID=UPI0019224680|nr:helix-turn-helix transcriptional regulator [Enterococcus sp. BWB1-3]